MSFTEKEFKNWLHTQKKISDSSIEKYISSIRQISNFLEYNLFDVNDYKSLENRIKNYFDDESNKEKNSRGHRQWSSAANNLKNFHKYSQNNNASNSIQSLNDDDYKEYDEGYKINYGNHKKWYRDSKLPKKKKQIVLKEKGKLACEVCGFDFYENYGERGKKYIECHHNYPISQMKEGDKTTIDNLSLLCANCHRMIHRPPWWTIEKLKKELKK
tara:strand:- start:69 stop:713 length:645 start_codon:yes stop_codon:yes gene_type:complete